MMETITQNEARTQTQDEVSIESVLLMGPRPVEQVGRSLMWISKNGQVSAVMRYRSFVDAVARLESITAVRSVARKECKANRVKIVCEGTDGWTYTIKTPVVGRRLLYRDI
jgi:hypothetical protein